MVSKMIFGTLLAVVFALGLMTFSFAGDADKADQAKFEKSSSLDRVASSDSSFVRRPVFNNRVFVNDFAFEEDFNFVRVNPFLGFGFVQRPIFVVGED